MPTNPYPVPPQHYDGTSERRRTMSNESCGDLSNAVGKREFEVGGKELLDIWPADIICLGDFNDAEDLEK